MSDLNEQLRAQIEALTRYYASPQIGEGLVASADGDMIDRADVLALIGAARASAPAPQAAPSDTIAWDAFPGWLIDHHEGEPISELLLQVALGDMIAAAPAVAITQAATSEPVVKWIAENEDANKCCHEAFRQGLDAAQGAINCATPIAYTLKFKGSHDPINAATTYLRLEDAQHYAKVCSSMSAEIVPLYAAPVAHLAGTTPNTEAPSDELWAQDSREAAELQTVLATQYSAFRQPHPAGLMAWARAALSAQQAGVQEAPSEDTKDAARYRYLRKHALMGYPSSEGSNNKDAYLVITGYGWDDSEDVVDEAVDVALAAATQTEKKP